MHCRKAVGRYVGNLSNQIRRRLDALSAKRGVSGSQSHVLHFVMMQEEDVFQRDIEQEFFLRPPSATQLLKLMEKNGLIHRESTVQDARLKKIILTDKASALVDAVIPDLEKIEGDLTRNIPPEQLAIFFQVIEQMSNNLSG